MTTLASPKTRAALLKAGERQPNVEAEREEDGRLVILFTVPGTGKLRKARTAYIVGGEVVDVRDGFLAVLPA